jgi:hypothetical protein
MNRIGILWCKFHEYDLETMIDSDGGLDFKFHLWSLSSYGTFWLGTMTESVASSSVVLDGITL